MLDLAERDPWPHVLKDQGVALLFEKPSARTRNSTEIAVVQLGGHPVTLRDEEVGIDTRETAEDLARTLSCYHSAIAARVFDHSRLARLAAAGLGAGDQPPLRRQPSVPGAGRRAHPSPAFRRLGGRRDRVHRRLQQRHPVARTSGRRPGMEVRVATPEGYGPGGLALDAVKGADAVYTDVWTSMGQEAEAELAPHRLRRLHGRRGPDGPGRPGRCVPALPARAPGRGGQRRRPKGRSRWSGARPRTACMRCAAYCSSCWRRAREAGQESAPASHRQAARTARGGEPGPACRAPCRRWRGGHAGHGVPRPRRDGRGQGARPRRRHGVRRSPSCRRIRSRPRTTCAA